MIGVFALTTTGALAEYFNTLVCGYVTCYGANVQAMDASVSGFGASVLSMDTALSGCRALPRPSPSVPDTFGIGMQGTVRGEAWPHKGPTASGGLCP